MNTLGDYGWIGTTNPHDDYIIDRETFDFLRRALFTSMDNHPKNTTLPVSFTSLYGEEVTINLVHITSISWNTPKSRERIRNHLRLTRAEAETESPDWLP